ncbi:MAG: beta-galactosidase, partial [Clostridia bacterium]|nr:beta-galactosidase [Clostridia bacterium]
MKKAKRIISSLIAGIFAIQLLFTTMVSAADYSSMVTAAEAKISELNTLLTSCQSKGMSPDYEKSDCGIAEIFTTRMRSEFDGGNTDNIEYYSDFVSAVYNDVKPKLNSYLDGSKKPVKVDSYVSDSYSITEDGLQVKYSDGATKGASLIGFNMFESYSSTMASLRGHGFNVTEYDGRNFGPGTLLTYSNGQFSPSTSQAATNGIDEFRTNMNRLRNNNIMVSVTVPIHYINSGWGLPKETGKIYTDFIPYNPTAQMVKDMIKAYYAVVGPVIDEYSDIISNVVLVNEPYFEPYDKTFYADKWTEFLTDKYGTVSALNTAYGKSYANISSVSMPSKALGSTTGKVSVTRDMLYYDYKAFQTSILEEYFTDLITEFKKYSDIPCGVKTMQFLRSRLEDDAREAQYSTRIMYDYEKFADLFDYNGTDTFVFYDDTSEKIDTRTKIIWYDLISSLNEKPIFDTESHLFEEIPEGIIEYDGEYADYVMTNTWMGALHNVDITALWLYSSNQSAMNNTSFSKRPYETRALAKTALDASRLSQEISAFKNKDRKVAILYSLENRLFSDQYMSNMNESYKLIVSNGQRPLFITENDLSKLEDCKVLVVPGNMNVRSATVTAIQSFKDNGGKVVFIGQNCFTKDEYNKSQSSSAITNLKNSSTTITATLNASSKTAAFASSALLDMKSVLESAGLSSINLVGS